jgi:hypothetical protein
METVKIVFDVDSKDIKSTTDELKALNKVTNDEVAAMEKLSASATDAGDGFVSLRTRVKEAKEEAVKAAEKYGEFSKEAQAAKVKAGQLADQMGDLNRQVNLLNPEAKAKAFSNLAQGVVGAFAVATGALQAFGVKNKDVEALAMKLQGALNITQGIASLGALKESLQDVKVVLGFTTAAQNTLTSAKETDIAVTKAGEIANKEFTASLAPNPVFIAVAAIGALVGAYILLNQETSKAILNEEQLKEARKKTTELKNKEQQTAIDLLVAQEKITKQEGERRKIELKRLEDTKDLTKQTKELSDEQTKSNQKIIDLEKEAQQLKADAAKERDPELRKAYQANAASAQSMLATEKEKNAKIKESYKVLIEQKKLIDQSAVNETNQQNIDELNDNKSKNEKLIEQNKAKSEKDKAEAERRRKESQQEWDKIMAEEEARASIEASRIQERSKAILAIEKQLQEESNRARLLTVKGDKVKELQVQMDILDEQYAMDILNAERTGKDTAAIRAKYANDQTALNQQITDAAIEESDKQIKAKQKQNDEQKKADEQAAADRVATAKFALDSIAQLSQAYAELQKSQLTAETAQLEEQYNKKLINEKTYTAKLREIKRKQWEADKRASILQATIGIAQGIVNALSVQPANLVPFAVGLASTVGALQLATIIATKPPQFAKGTLSVPGIDMGRDSVHAILQPGEAVIPTKTNRAYHPTIKAIYEKKISPSEINNYVMSRTKAGGSSAITANVDTYALSRALGKNKTVEVGNANVIGRAMAKELLRGQNYRRA